MIYPQHTRAIKQRILPYLLLLPTFILIGIFFYGVLSGLAQGLGIMPFVDKTTLTAEYVFQAFSRTDFIDSLAFSMYISAVSSVLALASGMVLSACLISARVSTTTALCAIGIPLMSAHILVASCMVSLFSGSGICARLLYHLNLIASPEAFPSIIGAPSGWGIIAVYLWKEIPFVAFTTFAIMQRSSETYSQAAITLGAHPLRAFIFVTLPLCRTTLAKAFLIIFSFSFGSYEIPYLLGPTIPKALPVLAYIEFCNPDILNRCYAMAINGIMTSICAIIAVLYFVLIVRENKARTVNK